MTIQYHCWSGMPLQVGELVCLSLRTVLTRIGTGLVIAVFLIPQAMAYAQLAGVDPINGLYSAIFALLVYPWFATSPQLSVGPVAVVSAVLPAAYELDAPPAAQPHRACRCHHCGAW